MELELGLKLTNVVDDFAAAELLISKDRDGPLFLCTQNDSMFILTAHLKGYKRRNIKIDINEDGSRIALSGEKPVQEMLMVGWTVVKKETDIRAFRKVFKIPSGVILDKIKAKFNDEESILTISMPKLVKGVTLSEIEEMKEEVMLSGETGSLHLVADEVSEGGTSQQEEPSEAKGVEVQEVDGIVADMFGSPESLQLNLEREEDHEPTPAKGVEVQEVDGKVADMFGSPESLQLNLEREEDHESTPENAQMVESNDSTLKKVDDEKGHYLREKVEIVSKEIEKSEVKKVEPSQVSQQNELPIRNPVLEQKMPPDGIPPLKIETQEKGTQTEKLIQIIQEHGEPENDQVEPTCLKQMTVEDQGLHVQEVGQTEDGIQNNEEATEAGSLDDEPNLAKKEREFHDQSPDDDKGHRRKSKKICAPMIVGSALFVSLVVIVIHLIRAKNQTSKKRN